MCLWCLKSVLHLMNPPQLLNSPVLDRYLHATENKTLKPDLLWLLSMSDWKISRCLEEFLQNNLESAIQTDLNGDYW